MKKYIIFKSFNDYKITDLDNYNTRIMDANKVITIKECCTLYDAKRTAIHYLHLTDEQIMYGSI